MSQWQTVPFNDFQGLDLTSSPDVSPCLDLYNVEFDRRGALRARDGVTRVRTQASTTLDNLFGARTTDGTVRLLHAVVDGGTAQCEATDSSGSIVASQNLTDSSDHYFARWGSPTGEHVYFTDGATGVRRYALATDTFSVPAGMPTGAVYISVQPTDNRLVVARKGGAVAGDSPSTVQFSNAGAPETWSADDYVELTPGDGEDIRGVCPWREHMFVFKQSKFFVFYGNSVDSTGGAVFNYRAVDTGVGLAHDAACVAGPDGVYFAAADGIYLTNGGPPRKVSRQLDPLFGVGSLPAFFTGSTGFPAVTSSITVRLAYFNDRLYVTYRESLASPRMLVFDPALDVWTLWQVPYEASVTPGGLTHVDGTLYLGTHKTTTLNVYKFFAGSTTDNGTAIDSWYRTGFYDLGVAEEKRTRQMTVWGTGAVDLALSRDFGSLDAARSLTLGTSPAIDRGTTNCAKDGIILSHEFSGTGAWTIYRAAMEFMPKRPSGSKTP